jgi:prepilin-type processing-associated H-X9-DG protein
VYNNRISGKSIGEIDDPVTKFMTADGETVISKNRTLENVYYSSADIQYRHNKQAVVSYLDGHVGSTDKLIEKESWDKNR